MKNIYTVLVQKDDYADVVSLENCMRNAIYRLSVNVDDTEDNVEQTLDDYGCYEKGDKVYSITKVTYDQINI